MNSAAVFTVVLSGIPRHDPRYNLENLAKFLDKVFDKKIGTFCVREVNNKVAVDFKHLSNAKLAKKILHGRSFTLENGKEQVLGAHVVSDLPQLPDSTFNDYKTSSSGEDSVPNTSNSILKKVDQRINEKVQEALIKERKKIKALLARNKLSSDDESELDTRKLKKKMKKSKKSKRKRKKSSSSDSEDSSDPPKRMRTDSSSSGKTPDLRNKLRNLHRYRSPPSRRLSRERSSPRRRFSRERSPPSRRLSRERSPPSWRLSPDTKYQYRRKETNKRERPSSRDVEGHIYLRDRDYSRPGSSRDSWRPRRRSRSYSRSRSRSRESRFRRSRSRGYEYRRDKADPRYDSLVSPRPGLKAIEDAYRPNISEAFASKQNKTTKPRDEFYHESILVKKKSPVKVKKEVDADKIYLETKETLKEAVKRIVSDLSEDVENLCVVHDASPDDRKRVLTELLETTLERLLDVHSYPGISVEALVMRYRLHSSRPEDKERLEKIFLSVLSTRQIDWKSSNIQNKDLNELDDILAGLPSFMEDVKPKIETIELDKEEGEIDDDEDDTEIVSISKPVINISPRSIKQEHKTRNYSSSSTDLYRESEPIKEYIEREPNNEHLELFTMNDPPYKVHITVNNKRCKRFFMSIKKLLRPLKQHMKKHKDHIELRLFLHIGRLILEKRIWKLLEGNNTKYRTPAIVNMYREVYPIEDDEKFVVETLCDIWRGLYNDDVYVDVVPAMYSKKVKSLEVVVKQEITEVVEIKKENDADEQFMDTTEANGDKEIKKEKIDTVISIKQEKTPDITSQIRTESTTTDLPQNQEKDSTPIVKSENKTNDTQNIKQEITSDLKSIKQEKNDPTIATKIKIENDPDTSKGEASPENSGKNTINVKKETELSAVKEEPNNGNKTTESKVEKNISAGTQEVKKEIVLISDDEEECEIIETAEKIVIDDEDDDKIVVPDDDKIVIVDSGDEVKDSQDYDSDSTVILQVTTEPQKEQETITNKDPHVNPKSNEELQANNKINSKNNEENEAGPMNGREGKVERIEGDKAAGKESNINGNLTTSDTSNVIMKQQSEKPKDSTNDILDTFKNIDTEESVEKILEFLQQT